MNIHGVFSIMPARIDRENPAIFLPSAKVMSLSAVILSVGLRPVIMR
jgi:hypothetical protein